MDESRPALTAYEDLAGLMEHSLLRPDMAEDQVHQGCDTARQYRVACVTVRPSDVDTAVRWMEGSGIAVGSVVGFPHGSATTAVKLYEARDLLRRGAREIEMVVNVGKLVSRQFQHLESEIVQMVETCHADGAALKLVFENAYLTTELKIIACKLSRLAGVDYAKTSTPFGPGGWTLDDLALMKPRLAGRVKLAADGRIDTLESALAVYNAGCDRFSTTATAAILEEWKAELKRAAHAAQS
jgi:deoxyribose-phosphate aldolase